MSQLGESDCEMHGQAGKNSVESVEMNRGVDMLKRIMAMAIAVISILIPKHTKAEEFDMTEINIQGSMGNLYGILQTPGTDEPLPLIILSHGFGGSHAGNRDYADYFTAHGFATFNFDFCGGGFGSKSDGTMLEMSVLTEAEDLNAIVDHFKGDGRFTQIFLWGASQGGFVSSYVAARRPEDVAALMLEFPAFVLQDDAKKRANPDGSFPETESVMGITIGHRYGEDAVSSDIYDVIGDYKGDVLILHGDRDGIVPLRYSERAANVYENAELVVMEGQNHGFMGEARTEAMKRETAFFRQHSK